MNNKISVFLPSLFLGILASGFLSIFSSSKDIFYFLLSLFFTVLLSTPIEGCIRKLITTIKKKEKITLWIILTILSPIPLLLFILMMFTMV